MFIIFSDDDFISYYLTHNFSSHSSFKYGRKCVHVCSCVCRCVDTCAHERKGTKGQHQVSFPRILSTSFGLGFANSAKGPGLWARRSTCLCRHSVGLKALVSMPSFLQGFWGLNSSLQLTQALCRPRNLPSHPVFILVFFFPLPVLPFHLNIRQNLLLD